MKFLCVQCDEGMALEGTEVHRDIGSLTVTYGCPKCGKKMAMLTNPHETQMLMSFGVSLKVPGAAESVLAVEGGSTTSATDSAAPGASKCPFAKMLNAGDGGQSAATPPVERIAVKSESVGEFSWSDGARVRFERLPSFVQPMARVGIEEFARSRGLNVVTEELLDQARASFGI